MKKILALGEDIAQNFYTSQKGKTLSVLVEKSNGNTWSGWTENYIEAHQDNFEIIDGLVKRNSIIL